MLRALAYWAVLQRSQWYRGEKLLKIQERKLRTLLNKAIREVEFYRELYRSIDFSSSRNAHALLQRLPIVTRKMLSDTPLQKRTAASVDPSKTLKRTTAGSTGTPVAILETKSSAAHWHALYLRRLWAWGVRPGDRILRMLPATPATSIGFFIGENPLDRLFKNVIRLFDMSAGINAQFLEKIIKSRATVLLAQPSTILAIIKKMEENDVSLSFKIVATTGEALTLKMRKKIQYTFYCDVYDQYSTVELGNIAWECPTHTAYHINNDSVVLELSNPRQIGRSTLEGEAISTCLYRYATPVIRYLIGDVVRIREDECPCGRGLPLLEGVEGRLVDYIVAKDGVLISPYVLTTALQKIEGIQQFRIIQHPDYTVEVQAIPAENLDLEKLNLVIEAMLAPLLHGLQLKVKFTDSIQVKGVKFRLVESLVPK